MSSSTPTVPAKATPALAGTGLCSSLANTAWSFPAGSEGPPTTAWSKVGLYSDSKYVIDSLSKGWAAKWRANGWRRNKNEPAINPELWDRLLVLCEANNMTYHWVKGHSGNPENERCDQLATQAAAQPNLPSDGPYEGTT